MAFFYNKTMLKRFSFDFELCSFLSLILKTLISKRINLMLINKPTVKNPHKWEFIPEFTKTTRDPENN